MIVDVNNPRDWKSKVCLNGEDVSRWCVYADDEVGLVKIYKHDDQGILRPRELEEKRGQVTIERLS